MLGSQSDNTSFSSRKKQSARGKPDHSLLVFLSPTAFPVFIGSSPVVTFMHVVVKKTVRGRNWSIKACEPILHTHARQEAYKDEVGTSEDQAVGFGW